MKRKSTKQIESLDFGMFEGYCMFIIGFDYKQTHASLVKGKKGDWILGLEETKSLWDNHNWGFVCRRTVANKDYFYLVLRDLFDFSDESYTKLAHEILHLASFRINEVIDPMLENECFCYLHTYLMRSALKILRS